jgi:thiol-disulfide isomerase/thioredoxin
MSMLYAKAQPLTWEMDTVSQYAIPVGICSWNDLKRGEFFAEMENFYIQYQPKREVVERIAALLRVINDRKSNESGPQFDGVTVYFGAWCGDSKEYLPAFIKICDLLQNEEQVALPCVLVACNHAKEHGLPVQEFDFKIELVPTFVFQTIKYENASITRQTFATIVETPQATIEEDIEDILHKLVK